MDANIGHSHAGYYFYYYSHASKASLENSNNLLKLTLKFHNDEINDKLIMHYNFFKSRPDKGLVTHSDRGVQYASKDFKRYLKAHGFIQSMSRKGDCWDNAVAESFFHTFKTQLIHHVKFETFEEAEKSLFKYIEIYYNRRRKHSANSWRTPAYCDQAFSKLKKMA